MRRMLASPRVAALADNTMRQVDLAARFGQNLARYRKRAGYSQEELGALASLHRTEIGMLERGIRLPRIDTLIKLAGALEMSPGDLLDGIDWMPGSPQIGRFRFEEPSPGDPDLN